MSRHLLPKKSLYPVASEIIDGLESGNIVLPLTIKDYDRSLKPTPLSAVKEYLQNIGAAAERTNIFALNAAMQAAMARERGRPFAEKANEVSALAGETRELCHKIEKAIHQLEQEIYLGNTLKIEERLSRLLSDLNALAKQTELLVKESQDMGLDAA